MHRAKPTLDIVLSVVAGIVVALTISLMVLVATSGGEAGFADHPSQTTGAP